MPKTVALAIIIAILGAIWTLVALLGPLSSYLLVWAGFIAWACFFQTGGDDQALTKTLVGNIFGIIIAWIVVLILANVQDPIAAAAPLWTAIVVGVGLFILVVASTMEQLSVFPVQTYGFAAVLAHTGLSDTAGANLLAVSFGNPLILLIVSMVIGALLGWLSQRIAAQISGKSVQTPEQGGF